MPETIKNKELMKICETYVDTLYYQREENRIARSFLDGGSEIEKRGKDGRKKHSQNNEKTRKLMLLHQDTLELVLKNVTQYLV